MGARFLRLGDTIKKTWQILHFVARLLVPIFSFPTRLNYTPGFWVGGAGFSVGAFLSDMGEHRGTSRAIWRQKLLGIEPLTAFGTQQIDFTPAHQREFFKSKASSQNQSKI